MAGTQDGGKAAAKTNKKRHGKDFYAKIGAKGGKISRGGGFAANRELAREAGRKGGKLSRRSKATKAVDETTAVVADDQNDSDES